MITTNTQIRMDQKALWPLLKHRWVFDQEFWLDDLEDLRSLIAICRPRIEPYVQFRGEFGDCDDHSHILISEMKKVVIERAINEEYPPEQMRPRPYGRAMGSMFRGLPMPHSLCIGHVRQGIYLFEGHEDRLWKADGENDQPFCTFI